MIETRGMRDLSGNEAERAMILKERAIRTFRRYGFEPLETTIIEDARTLTMNGGDEIRKEIFSVSDGTERDLALRFDLTVPLARHVAGDPHLPLPFKRYEIGPVFRNGPISISQGRYRKFTQMDADIVGGDPYISDVETLSLGRDLLAEFGLGEAKIRLNDRRVLNDLLDAARIPKEHALNAILTIDKVDKIGIDGVATELSDQGISTASIDTIIGLIEPRRSNDETLAALEPHTGEALGYLSRIAETIDVEIRPDLARGLSYYTGLTFEVFIDGFENAIGAGGRYDDMIRSFAKTKREYPAVGISFGLERLISLMPSHNHQEGLYLIPLEDAAHQANNVSQKIRSYGIDVFLGSQRSIIESFNDAERRGYRYAGILGSRELISESIGLRDLRTREQRSIPIGSLSEEVC
jgi:histidyl-tRNA synthetase